MADISTKLVKTKLRNPTILASGILGTSAELLIRISENGAGAVTLKSIGPLARDGHNNPTVVDFGYGLINAVGLPSPGYRNMEEEWKKLRKLKIPLIASIYGGSVKEFSEVAEYVAAKKPEFIEMNISCPNTKEHGMIFGKDEKMTFDVVSSVKNTVKKIPIIPKLTPNCSDIRLIAKACEDAGADAVCAINTVGPGMLIDIETAKPILSFKKGGISGPAIKPIAVRCVYDIFETVNIPIIGLGGICNGQNAIEIIMAGATAVGIGSAVYYRGIPVFNEVCEEMNGFMVKNGYKSIKEIIGLSHK